MRLGAWHGLRRHRVRAPLRTELVSVVIPCYRYGHFLRDAVSSVLQQRGVEGEVIVVDDASPDDSAAVALALSQEDPRVRVILHEENRGHIATYNEGLAACRGEYVLLLSADDAIAEGSLARAVALLQSHPDVGFVYGHAESFSGPVPRLADEARSWSTWSAGTWLGTMSSRCVNPVYTPSAVMRRRAWEECGPYDPELPHAADMLLWYATSARWGVGRVNNRAQAYYRVHGENMHLTQFAGMMRDLREQRIVMDRVFGERSLGSSAASQRAAAYRALARRALRLAAEAGQRGQDPEAALAYTGFAEEVMESAAVRPRRGLLAVDRWMEGDGARWVRRVARHLEWRRWRRWGI